MCACILLSCLTTRTRGALLGSGPRFASGSPMCQTSLLFLPCFCCSHAARGHAGSFFDRPSCVRWFRVYIRCWTSCRKETLIRVLRPRAPEWFGSRSLGGRHREAFAAYPGPPEPLGFFSCSFSSVSLSSDRCVLVYSLPFSVVQQDASVRFVKLSYSGILVCVIVREEREKREKKKWRRCFLVSSVFWGQGVTFACRVLLLRCWLFECALSPHLQAKPCRRNTSSALFATSGLVRFCASKLSPDAKHTWMLRAFTNAYLVVFETTAAADCLRLVCRSSKEPLCCRRPVVLPGDSSHI